MTTLTVLEKLQRGASTLDPPARKQLAFIRSLMDEVERLPSSDAMELRAQLDEEVARFRHMVLGRGSGSGAGTGNR